MRETRRASPFAPRATEDMTKNTKARTTNEEPEPAKAGDYNTKNRKAYCFTTFSTRLL